jgi:ferredoxin
MPKLTVEGHGTYDVPEGKKLVLAIEDAGIAVLHRCGGVPACTTCRVRVLSGETTPMQTSEEEALEEPELIENWRLSCQLRVQSDTTVALWATVGEMTDFGKAFDSPGERPED